MKIEFYGVRGSAPTPGKDTVIFGGNTSCVYVTLKDGQDILLDAGTGIIALGNKLSKSHHPINILLTHNHWDHIQGFPFFKPIYQTNRKINIVAGATEFNDKDIILKQMSGSNHPVKYDQLPADITVNDSIANQKVFELSSFTIKTQLLNHPDGGTAYCLYGDDKKLAYVTDNELNPPKKMKTSWQQWKAFVSDADILIHDAQYNESDIPLKQGWGHSTFSQVAKLASEAKVKSLFIISHDPARTDAELLQEEQRLQQQYSDYFNIYCAREGTVVDLDK